MGKLIRHIQQSFPTKISLWMFLVAVLVFFLGNGIFLVKARRHFHTIAMNNVSEALSAAVARVERQVKSVETTTKATALMAEDNILVIGHGEWGEPLDQNTIAYTYSIYDNKDQLKREVSTELSLTELSRGLSSIKPYPHSYMIILGHDGRFYAHEDTTKIVSKSIFDLTNGRYYPDKLALGYEMTIGNSGRMHADVGGVRCLICYQPVPGTNWSAALISPEHDVMHRYRHLNISILIIIFIGLLIILFLCGGIVARAFEPLKLLEEQTRKITEGDYTTVIERSNAKSVVGYLQNSFADMQEVIGSNIRNLNAANEESVRRNNELQHANARLEEAIERQTTFVANMTHQIRTPLNLILGFSQLLRETGGNMPDEERKRLLGVIDYYSMTLNRMSMMLYDSSDRGYHDEKVSLSYDEVSCNEVARECIGYTNRYFPDVSVKLQTTLEDSFTIVTDHLYLMRSIREILYNSAKYSDGKNVSLRVSATRNSVRFIFEDTGPGIKPEYQKHIFTPFYKSDDLSEGLGVGLSLTKRHVILLGGSLDLDPDYRKGCKFIMVLPLESPIYQ